MLRRILILTLAAVAAACAPKRIHEEPILRTGDRVADPDRIIADAARTREANQALAARRDSLTALALADCTGAVCDALARGEVALGMSVRQVLAATGTTEAAWSIRNSGDATVMVGRNAGDLPRDAVGRLALVQLGPAGVTRYSYREAQGVRLVATPADATGAGRAAALGEMLMREGDDFVAAGDLAAALDRYDRADVLGVDDPELQYKIASLLDKQLRPVEALMRYQLFLHRMELEKIEAKGDAYAKLADAIARARERVIVLEKQTAR